MDMAELETRLTRIEDIEAIKQLNLSREQLDTWSAMLEAESLEDGAGEADVSPTRSSLYQVPPDGNPAPIIQSSILPG